MVKKNAPIGGGRGAQQKDLHMSNGLDRKRIVAEIAGPGLIAQERVIASALLYTPNQIAPYIRQIQPGRIENDLLRSIMRLALRDVQAGVKPWPRAIWRRVGEQFPHERIEIERRVLDRLADVIGGDVIAQAVASLREGVASAA